MTLTELFSIYSQFKMGEKPLCEISSITCDSRSAAKGDVFVAIRGHSDDGHKYLKDVCARDVAAVVVEDETVLPRTFSGGILKVSSTRVAVGELAARFYGEPTRALYSVGVTGTSGKTSVTYLVEAILNKFGMPTGVIGTVDHHLGERHWQTTLTSPSPYVQRRMPWPISSLRAHSSSTLRIAVIAFVERTVGRKSFSLARKYSSIVL